MLFVGFQSSLVWKAGTAFWHLFLVSPVAVFEAWRFSKYRWWVFKHMLWHLARHVLWLTREAFGKHIRCLNVVQLLKFIDIPSSGRWFWYLSDVTDFWLTKPKLCKIMLVCATMADKSQNFSLPCIAQQLIFSLASW